MQKFLIATSGALLLAAAVTAQTPASYLLYGRACTHTVGSNLSLASPNLKTQTLPNEYCYGIKAPRALTVIGFSIYTRKSGTAGGPLTIDAGFYRQNAGGTAPLAAQATKGKLTVDNKANWYTCMFAAPQSVSAGESFWISQYDSNLVLASSTTNGTAPALRTFWRRPAGGGGSWAATGIVTGPVLAVIVKDESPVLQSVGLPKLGNAQFAIEVSNGNGASNLVRFLLGVSDVRTLSGISLPFDLGILGFSGCTLYASDEFYFGPRTTNAQGVATLPLPIPNIPALSGVNFYNQAFVIDIRSNKVSFTNAGKATAGT